MLQAAHIAIFRARLGHRVFIDHAEAPRMGGYRHDAAPTHRAGRPCSATNAADAGRRAGHRHHLF